MSKTFSSTSDLIGATRLDDRLSIQYIKTYPKSSQPNLNRNQSLKMRFSFVAIIAAVMVASAIAAPVPAENEVAGEKRQFCRARYV